MSMKHLIISILLLLSNLTAQVYGQEILSSQEAVAIAIENNFGVLLAENNIRLAENNRDKRALGYYPTVDANVGPNATFGGSQQNFNNGMTAETRNAFSWAAGAAVNARYNLLDPSRDLQLDQMKEMLSLSNLQLRQTIENTIIQVYNQYYNIALLAENLKAVEEALTLSRRRLERAELRVELGQGLSLDKLNAKVDISRDSVNFLDLSQQVENAKRDLEVIIGSTLPQDFDIDSSVDYDMSLTSNALTEKAITNNVNLLLSDQNQVISQYDLDLLNALNKPTIATNAGVNYNYSVGAPGSFIKSSSNSGLNLGVTLNWNLFDGGRRKVLEQNTKIAMESESLTKEQIVRELKRDIDNAWGNYQNALYILDVEQNSLNVNIQNLDRTTNLYNRGQLTSLDFRQAQLNLLNSEVGYSNARYQAKLIELQLIYLSGDIMSINK